MTGKIPGGGLDLRPAAGPEAVAIEDPGGTWTYGDLDRDAGAVAAALLDGCRDLDGARVGLLCTPGHDFVTAVVGCWRAGAIAVPLHPEHPAAELRAALADADVAAIVTSPAHADSTQPLAAERGAPLLVLPIPPPPSAVALPVVDDSRGALMVYTSGTTGRPKGVVHTHANVAAQVDALLTAWGWRADDRALLVLPLHHVHGIMAVTLCALAAGATCEAPGAFDATHTWERLASGELTVLMAVPTIYARLIATWEAADPAARRRWSDGARRARLMVSGSAALPVSTLARWQELTGQVLLERYGMTEFGMALSNTLERRVPGHVGEPLPGIEVRVVDEQGADVAEGESGELLVRGPAVFATYWNRPEETAASFVDGWFRTGDVAVHTDDGYRLLGRSSVDIIKSGGEKISALEVEEVFRTHPDVADCAVVGVEDDEWGQRVCMAVVAAPGSSLVDAELRAWGKERLAAAKVPTRYRVVDALPRNAMGKVTKVAVAAEFERPLH